MENNQIPISTQWLIDASDTSNVGVINSVYLIFCQKTQSKGTGFLIIQGFVVTNWHVIRDCSASEIIAISSSGKKIEFSELKYDENKDLAVLTPKVKLEGGLELDNSTIKTETKVITWGHPLAYNGPSPVLSVGYVAGFRDHKKDLTSQIVKRYIVNGAFNPGNSGGPLLTDGDKKVIGIVVAKHAPISNFLKSAIEALSKNASGVVFTYTENGIVKNFVESQVVAMLLEDQRKMTQVMLGEAILSSELISFLG